MKEELQSKDIGMKLIVCVIGSVLLCLLLWFLKLLNPWSGSFCSIILFVFICSLIQLHNESRKLKADLDKALLKCQEFSNQKKILTTENFEDLNQSMLTIPAVCEQWEEFTQTIVEDEDPFSKQVIKKNTVQVENFINHEKIVEHRIHLAWQNAVPSILAGLGLVGTFLSLLIGLKGLVDPITKQVTQVGVTHLIEGLTIKFVSSIVGLGSSILYTVLEKNLYLGPIERSCLRLQQTIDGIFDRYTTESILLKLLKNSNEQSIALRQFNTDLADKIGANISENFNPILNRLVNTLSTLESQIVETIKGVTNQTRDALLGGTNDDVKSLSESIKQTAHFLSDLQTNNAETERKTRDILGLVEQTISKQNDQMNSNSIQTQQLMESLVKNVSELNQQQQSAMQDTVTGVLSRTSEINNQITQTAQNQAMNAEELKSASEKLAEVIKGFDDVLNKNKEVTYTLAPVVSQISQAAKDLSGVSDMIMMSQDLISKLVSDFNSQGQNYNQSMILTMEQLNKQKEIFASTHDSLTNVVKQIDYGLNQYANTTRESINGFTSQFDAAFSSAVSQLTSNIDELKDNLEELTEVIEAKVGTLQV